MKKRGLGSLGRWAWLLLVTTTLAACGGGNDTKKYPIGGTVTGLDGTVVLQNNGADDLSVGASGTFTFGGKVKKGKGYAVTVRTQPAGQTCTVANGSGTASAAVTNVSVTCEDNPSFTVGGTVTGLSGTVVLQNDPDELVLDVDGPFTFPTAVRSGLGYSVAVTTQPAGQTCTVANGTGNVAGADVTNVTVTCVDGPTPGATYSIGGSVSGLDAGKTLQLKLEFPGPGAVTKDITANGAFSFDPAKVSAGQNWLVTVQTQPVGQACSVTNGGGVANADVTNVTVTCVASTTDYSVGGTISGLTGTGLKIENGAANSVSPAASATTFTLPNRFANGATYDVGIAAQPTGQTCVITHSSGGITGRDVTNVAVTCIDNVTDPIVGTYAVPALMPGSLVYITLFADGVYVYGSVENNPGCGGTLDGNGVEYGVYNYNKTTGAFTIKSAVVDTNGGCGVWFNGPRYNGTLSVSGTGQAKTMTLTVPGAGSFDLVPVDSTAGQLFGGWSTAYRKSFLLFLDAGGGNVHFFSADSRQESGDEDRGRRAGIEYACGTLQSGTAASGALAKDYSAATCVPPQPDPGAPVNTDGTNGLDGDTGAFNFAVTDDSMDGDLGSMLRNVPN